MQVLGCRRPRAGVRGDDRVSRLRPRGGELGQTRAARVRAQAREHPEVPGLQVTVTVWYWLTLGDIGCQGAQEPRHVAEDLVQHDREGGEGQPLGPRLQRGGGAAVTCQVHVTLVIDVM